MISGNDSVRTLLGVDKWHEAGYFGEGVNIANGEKWSLDKYNPEGLCSAPICADVDNDHGEDTARVLHEFAPKARLIQLPFNSAAYREACYNYIQLLSVPLMTYSKASYTGDSDWDSWLETVSGFCTAFVAAGNEGDDDYNRYIKNSLVQGVGAVALNGDTLSPASYSSESEYLDWCGITDVYVSELSKFTGTSCATPALCGMMALVQELFLQKTGYPLGVAGLRQFMADNCVDLEADGFDVKSGYGLVVLPPPETVDVWAYQDAQYKLEEVSEMDIKEFADYDQIEDYQKTAIQACVDNGVLCGDDQGCVNPKEPITRGDLALVIARTMGWV